MEAVKATVEGTVSITMAVAAMARVAATVTETATARTTGYNSSTSVRGRGEVWPSEGGHTKEN